ncbi:hypothetical protein N7530_010142 [Penicillium desertorum]|uniref:Uncharacterized protein n=1 Tax=Penicillium desertorum TaxID=1303715 RepID=A0A9W9WJY2_9EURO|nr:hypothetical protein N7530_010142 [Penicillium desertorum]
MTDSNEEGLRGTVKCLLPGKERSSVTNNDPRTQDVKRMSALPGLGPSNALSILLGRSRSWPAHIQVLCGEQTIGPTASRPCRSKSGVKTGLDMKDGCQDARDAQQHEPVMSGSEILCSTK